VRKIEQSGRFKRDLKREARGQHRLTLEADLLPAIAALANDMPLQRQQRDHDLTGDWGGCRECHVKPDLLLIYQKMDTRDGALLRLVRLGSHSELFG
jgi:mRNA interferase YafQ